MGAAAEIDVLSGALDALPEGIAVFDAAGGLLFWNSRYVEIYAHPPGFLRVGLPFETVIRRIAGSGRVPVAIGREEEWVAERLRHRAAERERAVLAQSGGRARSGDGRGTGDARARVSRGAFVSGVRASY